MSIPVRIHERAARLGEGQAVRFACVLHGVPRDAFAVRWRGRFVAWVNACRHQNLPLDFGDARFLDDAGDALVCVHHGARYDPVTGVCVEGPCAGARLTALEVEERDGALWWVPPASGEVPGE